MHFGDTSEGGSLETISLTLGSDALFGACCHEISHDKSLLQSFIDSVKEQHIVLSSLFPYRIDNGEYQLYIPSPIMQIDSKEIPITSFEETKRVATEQKKIKKSNIFVHLSYRTINNIFNLMFHRSICLSLVLSKHLHM